MQYPIEYKMIPTQHAFLIDDTGKVQVQAVTTLEDKQFDSEQEAREWVRSLKVAV